MKLRLKEHEFMIKAFVPGIRGDFALKDFKKMFFRNKI